MLFLEVQLSLLPEFVVCGCIKPGYTTDNNSIDTPINFFLMRHDVEHNA